MQYPFIIEFFKRLGTSSPRFFKILGWVSAIGAGLTATLNWLIQEDIWEFASDTTEVKIAKVLGKLTWLFGGSVITSLTTTTKANLQDDKTVKNIVSERL